MRVLDSLKEAFPQPFPWLPITLGLGGVLLFFTYVAKGDEGDGDDNIVDKDAVVAWGDWSDCSAKGKQYRFSTILTPAVGNGNTPPKKEEKDCEPKKEDDAIVWENWNSTRIINEYKMGRLTYLQAYKALEEEHGWSNNDITDELTAEGIQSLDSSQSFMSQFY